MLRSNKKKTTVRLRNRMKLNRSLKRSSNILKQKMLLPVAKCRTLREQS